MNTEERKRNQKTNDSFEFEEPIIVSPSLKKSKKKNEVPVVEIQDDYGDESSDLEREESKKDKMINMKAPGGIKNPSGRVQPLKSKTPLTAYDSLLKKQKKTMPEYMDDSVPKVPEKVMNLQDLMPSPKKNPMETRKLESPSFRSPSGFNQPDSPLKESPIKL